MSNSKIISDFKQKVIDFNQTMSDLSGEDFEKLSLLRSNGLLDDNASKFDFVFIAEMSDKLPRRVIADCIGMSINKVWHYQKKHNLQNIDAPETITAFVANESFRFLIEKQLKFSVDKTLPKAITTETLNGPYYSIYTYARDIVNKRDLSKKTSAIGYLACAAYPDKFRFFQFRMGNDVDRFDDIEELNLALVWSFEKMTEIDLFKNEYDENALRMLINEPSVGFDADELRNYYIPRKAWNKFYPSFKELKNGLIRFVGLSIAPAKFRYTTSKLREVLIKSGRDIEKCEICSHKENLHIHHIYPVKGAQDLFNPEYINSSQNLIVLCRNHHGFAYRFDWQSAYSRGVKDIKAELISHIKSIDTTT